MNIIAYYKKQFFFSYKRWNRKFIFSKRQQFVLVTLALTVGMIATQLASADYRYPTILALSILTYFLSAFSLRDDLRGSEWMTLLVLPTLFTAAVALFYYLLPTRWLTRLPIAVLYAVGMYALLLTENIYNMAAIRTIALLRAAHSIGFLLTLVTFYLLIQTVLAARINIFINIVLIILVSILLAVQLLWSLELEPKISFRVKAISITLGIVMAELAWILSFWPANITLVALFLTTCFYSIAGLAQQYLYERLYRKTVNEFAVVTLIIFILLIFGTHWR